MLQVQPGSTETPVLYKVKGDRYIVDQLFDLAFLYKDTRKRPLIRTPAKGPCVKPPSSEPHESTQQ